MLMAHASTIILEYVKFPSLNAALSQSSNQSFDILSVRLKNSNVKFNLIVDLNLSKQEILDLLVSGGKILLVCVVSPPLALTASTAASAQWMWWRSVGGQRRPCKLHSSSRLPGSGSVARGNWRQGPVMQCTQRQA